MAVAHAYCYELLVSYGSERIASHVAAHYMPDTNTIIVSLLRMLASALIQKLAAAIASTP